MMNAITTTDPVSAGTLETVLGTGDLSKLSTQQRVEFYKAACHSLGLNPLTRPIRFLSFQGQMQAYFTRDGTDQLRKLHNISLHVVDHSVDAGLYVVRVQAKMPSGRSDEDIGAVVLPQSGESRANAMMKATTKAKRRVTLSICGLGWSSEDELDTMPGAATFDAEDEVPDARDQINASVPMTKQVPLNKAAAAGMPRAPRVSEPETPRRTVRDVLASIEIALRDAKTHEEADRILCGEDVARGRQAFTGEAKDKLEEMVSAAVAKWWPEKPAEETPDDLLIHGEEKLAG